MRGVLSKFVHISSPEKLHKPPLPSQIPLCSNLPYWFNSFSPFLTPLKLTLHYWKITMFNWIYHLRSWLFFQPVMLVFGGAYLYILQLQQQQQLPPLPPDCPTGYPTQLWKVFGWTKNGTFTLSGDVAKASAISTRGYHQARFGGIFGCPVGS